MTTFLIVLAFIIGIALLCALLIWSVVVWLVGGDWGWRIRTRFLHTVGCVIILALIIATAINGGVFASNNAEHCGPGTHYVAESHYNVATKTTITDWMCTQ